MQTESIEIESSYYLISEASHARGSITIKWHGSVTKGSRQGESNRDEDNLLTVIMKTLTFLSYSNAIVSILYAVLN